MLNVRLMWRCRQTARSCASWSANALNEGPPSRAANRDRLRCLASRRLIGKSSISASSDAGGTACPYHRNNKQRCCDITCYEDRQDNCHEFSMLGMTTHSSTSRCTVSHNAIKPLPPRCEPTRYIASNHETNSING